MITHPRLPICYNTPSFWCIATAKEGSEDYFFGEESSRKIEEVDPMGSQWDGSDRIGSDDRKLIEVEVTFSKYIYIYIYI